MSLCSHESSGDCMLSFDADNRVTVLVADPSVMVSRPMYERTVATPHPDASAGEGVIQIRATNMLLTYILDPDGYCSECDAYPANRRFRGGGTAAVRAASPSRQ